MVEYNTNTLVIMMLFRILWMLSCLVFTTACSLPKNLYTALTNLSFHNFGTTAKMDKFVYGNVKPITSGQACLYLEPENVSCTVCAWSVNTCALNYKFLDLTDTDNETQNIVPPASGIRSAVPLGGIGAGSFELRGDGTFHEFTIQNNGPQGAAKIQIYNDFFFAAKINNCTRIIQTHPNLELKHDGVQSITYSGAFPFSKLTSKINNINLALYAWSERNLGRMALSGKPSAYFSLAVDNTDTDTETSVPLNVAFMLNVPLLFETDQRRTGTLLSNLTSIYLASQCLSMCNANSSCQSWVHKTGSGDCLLQSDAGLNFYASGYTSGLPGFWKFDNTKKCLTLVRNRGKGPMHGNVTFCTSFSSSSSSSSLSWHSAATSKSASHLLSLFANKSKNSSSNNNINNNINNSHNDHSNDDTGHGSVSIGMVLPPGEKGTLDITMGWFFPYKDHSNYQDNQGIPIKNYSAYGNHYVDLYPGGSMETGLGNINVLERSKILLESVNTASCTNNIFLQSSSLPKWYSDLVVNSMSHTRNAMWWQRCPRCHLSNDSRIELKTFGIWRQFEAFDCNDIDSIHNDGERHIPYIMFMTNGTRSKLAAWATNQYDNGMLAEQILANQPDVPATRNMSDVTSMFIVYVLELYQWDNDMETLLLYWPVIQRGVKWMLSTARTFGLPYHLIDTYDIMAFNSYDVAMYNSMFHIVGLESALRLAQVMNDTIVEHIVQTALARAKIAVDVLEWNSVNKFYNAGSSKCIDGIGCLPANFSCLQNVTKSDVMTNCTGGLFSDSFYAQVLGYSVGLGDMLVDPTRLDQHLQAVGDLNCVHTEPGIFNQTLRPGCPIGLITMTHRIPHGTDLMIWEMGTYNQASLKIHRGRNSMTPFNASVAAEYAMDGIYGTATSYSERINDQWNIAGVKFNNGNPSITSHYGYHMVLWHVMLALSGQKAEHGQKLSFAPRVGGSEEVLPICNAVGCCDWNLPVLLPGGLGTISCSVERGVDHKNYWRYELMFEIVPPTWTTLKQLDVDGISPSNLPWTVKAGKPIVWTNH